MVRQSSFDARMPKINRMIESVLDKANNFIVGKISIGWTLFISNGLRLLQLSLSKPYIVPVLTEFETCLVWAAPSFNDMVCGLRERDLVRQTLGRYVPEKVSEKLLQEDGVLETEEARATVLFADIKGFTTMTEKLRSWRDYISAQRLFQRYGGNYWALRRGCDSISRRCNFSNI